MQGEMKSVWDVTSGSRLETVFHKSGSIKSDNQMDLLQPVIRKLFEFKKKFRCNLKEIILQSIHLCVLLHVIFWSAD